MKKAIIVGGKGLIGRGLIEELIKKKIPILILGTSKNISKNLKIKDKNIQYHQLKDKKSWYENSIENIKKKFPTNDCVFFNLAWKGQSELTNGVIEDQLKNVHFSCRLIKLAKELGVKKYVDTGSLEELKLKRYVDGKYWIDEKNEIKPNWYALSKVSSWMQSSFQAYCSKIDFCHVRISVVIDINLKTNKFVENSLKDLLIKPRKIITNNNELCNISSSNEIGRQLIAVGKKGINNRIYTLGTSHYASLEDYFYKFLKMAHPTSNITKDNFKLKNLQLLKKKDFIINDLIDDTGYKPKENLKTLFKMLIV
jgi:nucleoside-diphosphate-sugar epimerase